MGAPPGQLAGGGGEWWPASPISLVEESNEPPRPLYISTHALGSLTQGAVGGHQRDLAVGVSGHGNQSVVPTAGGVNYRYTLG
jgi:hypothetical protein